MMVKRCPSAKEFITKIIVDIVKELYVLIFVERRYV